MPISEQAVALPRPTFGQLLRDPVLLLAFGFGSGLSPKAPGTAGSLLAMLAFPLLALLPLPFYLLVLAATVVAGTWICGRAADRLGVHDHGGIVLDEIAGVWLAMATFPATWPWMVAGFALFRLFDIVKPWPISWLDRRVPGGLGIMLDDLLAGALTWLVLWLVEGVLQ
jgi:phosphatidylglycerophosphatase A